MRNTILRVGISMSVLFFSISTNVGAAPLQNIAITDNPVDFTVGTVIERKQASQLSKTTPEEPKAEPAPAPVPPAVITHTIVSGDTLTKIANVHQTTWQRIFAKNIQIANPDTINVGETITIPDALEQLPERALPAPVVVAPQPTVRVSTTARRTVTSSAPQPRGSSAGNTYAAGYCTWYAKNRRPDLPNRLGNANTWVARAATQGIPTGSAPRAGAIGQQGMHVVYVESVNGDGTVTISEMNYKGLGVVSSRTAPASNFMYIY